MPQLNKVVAEVVGFCTDLKTAQSHHPQDPEPSKSDCYCRLELDPKLISAITDHQLTRLTQSTGYAVLILSEYLPAT